MLTRKLALTAAILALLGVGVAGCNPKKAAEDAKKAAEKAAKKAAKEVGKEATGAAKDAAKDVVKEAVTGEGEGEVEMVTYKCHMDTCDKTKPVAKGAPAPEC